jgi:nuclear pore complex protein Nup205
MTCYVLSLMGTVQDLMSGKQAFRNVMNILLMGVDTLIEERSTKVYGHVLEKVTHLSLQIILLALDHDSNLADAWCPLYQVFVSRT